MCRLHEGRKGMMCVRFYSRFGFQFGHQRVGTGWPGWTILNCLPSFGRIKGRKNLIDSETPKFKVK